MSDNYHPLRIFGLNTSEAYATRVAEYVTGHLSAHEELTFPDSEVYLRSASGIDGNVRGHDVFVISSLVTDTVPINDKLVRLLMFLGSLRDASAHTITAVLPYMGYARQDRKDRSRAPITTKYVAEILEAVGVSRVVTIDHHNISAYQNSFRIPTDNLESKILLSKWVVQQIKRQYPDLSKLPRIVVLSPDAGGYKRTEDFRRCLERVLGASVDIAIFDKIRHTGEDVKGGKIVGSVADSLVILYDDIISTAGTVLVAGQAIAHHGGNLWAVCAAHGLFVGPANERLHQLDTQIVVTDTVDSFRLDSQNRRRLHVVPTHEMVGEAIKRIHEATGSISDLLEV